MQFRELLLAFGNYRATGFCIYIHVLEALFLSAG